MFPEQMGGRDRKFIHTMYLTKKVNVVGIFTPQMRWYLQHIGDPAHSQSIFNHDTTEWGGLWYRHPVKGMILTEYDDGTYNAYVERMLDNIPAKWKLSMFIYVKSKPFSDP